MTVFISYLRDDLTSVNRLAKSLAARGVDSWLDRNAIAPGADWKASIRKAILGGSYFLGCFSKSYQRRVESYMHEEVAFAIKMLRSGRVRRNWLIPVVFSGSVPDIEIASGRNLRDIQWVSLKARHWDEGIDAIRAVIAGTEKDVRANLMKEFIYEGDGAYDRPLFERVRREGPLWNHLQGLKRREQDRILRRLMSLWPILLEWEKEFLKSLLLQPLYRPEEMHPLYKSLEAAISITYPQAGDSLSVSNVSWLVRQCYDQDSEWQVRLYDVAVRPLTQVIKKFEREWYDKLVARKAAGDRSLLSRRIG